jgi:hypothetical protein
MKKIFLLRALIVVGGIAGLFTSCIKEGNKDDNFTTAPPPPIGSYNNSNDVAAANLKAHWTFDGTTNEVISNTAPVTAKNNSYTTGVKGQALSLNAGYLLYPTIAALSTPSALSSVTVSMWVKIDNNGSQASELFAVTQSTTAQTDWAAIVNVYAETGHAVAYDDTLVLHAAVGSYASGSRAGGDNINDFGNRGTDFQTVLGTKKWVHYVMRYDATTSAIDIFANGIRVSNNNFRIRMANGKLLGPLVAPVPTQVLIGGFPNSSNGFPNSATQSWQALLTGSIDEIRVYNTALSDFDITALYKFEKNGA